MAFFEEIGKRLTDAGQSVAQQTRNFADVAQLNSAISDKEKRISKLFSDIGYAYYELHKNDANSELAEKVSEINVLYTQIIQDREKINQIKGITKCGSCGADVPIGSAFCNSCGAKVENEAPAAPEDNQRRCPNCGAVVAEGNSFCNRCGTKI